MNTECINSIDLKTNNNEIISVSNELFSNLYISNIDDNGDEINYETVMHSNALYANFFMIKLNKKFRDNDRLLNNKDIVNIGILFNNGYYQEFNLAKKRIANNGKLENIYENSFNNEDDDLCILICNKKIKYKKELFV